MLNVYSLRISPENWDKLKAIADKQHLPVRTMIQSWILGRMEAEE